MNCSIRSYSQSDRRAVRQVCADTGFLGRPIDGIFDDREVFADFFTRYYTDYEPENCFVAEDGDTGQVVGYLLGCLRYWRYGSISAGLLVAQIIPRVMKRLLAGRYDRSSRNFLLWVLFSSARQTPPAPARSAHFHLNLMPAYRTGVASREMFLRFIDRAQAAGVKRVYARMQSRDRHRNSFPPRFGFREYARRRVTKFDHCHPELVYVTTLYREFDRA